MKKLILSSAFLLLVCITFGQTTATNFVSNDCNGTSHNLFSELDAGKIIVLAWVMPCTSCITDPVSAYTEVQGYATSHPGKVLFYLLDDYGNTSCTSLSAWANTYAMTNSTNFSDNHISMTDYGTPGMPKIVVLGGSNHQVYFNQNSSSSGVKAAIDQAIADNPVGVAENVNTNIAINTFPNPANNVLNVEFTLTQKSVVNMEVINLVGANVMNVTNEPLNKKGTHNAQIDVSALTNGVYFLKITTPEGASMTKFVVSH